jgi:hypothetical protein
MRRLLILGLSAAPLLAHADAADLLAISNPALSNIRPSFHLTASGFAADDFIPAHRIADTWRETPDPRPGRNLAIGFGRLEASQSAGNWTLGTFKRFEAFGEGSSDTVRFYYAIANPDTLLSRTAALNLDYRFKGFSADGIRLAWSTPLQNDTLRFGAAINLLKAGTLRVERATGTVVSANGVATVNGRRELLYTGLDYTPAAKADVNDFSPAVRQSTDTGWGHALDLGMQWIPRSDMQVNLALNDLLGQLTWRNLPELTQDFNEASWPLEFNAPLATAKITGTNRYRNYTLHLKPKAAASLDWFGSDWGLGASVAARQGIILPEASAYWGRQEIGFVRLSYEPRFNSIGAGFRYGPVFANVRTDRTNLNDARAVGVMAGLALRF